MGFALWIRDRMAWAAGTHEYRPMGTAVIAASSLFRHRDFTRMRRPPKRELSEGFEGLFGSLEEANAFLRKRRSQNGQKHLRRSQARFLPLI